MADDTVYTVVDSVDTKVGNGSSSFFQKNASDLTSPPTAPDDTGYVVVAQLDNKTTGKNTSSFYEKNTVYQAAELSTTLLEQMTALEAAASADKNAADASASAAAVSETNAAASAAAAATSETHASSSETNAAASASAASTSASNASTSETDAANSASAAAASASTATTQAGIATTKAAAASTSETNAAASAAAAATSETNASSSASAAATSETNAAASAASAAATTTAAIAAAQGTAPPLVDGTAAVGTGTKWAHEDHVHPTDTSRASVSYVDTQDGTLAAGLLLRAPLASPALTGNPTAPTQTAGDNSTKLATTAFVLANAAAGALQPANNLSDVASVGTARLNIGAAAGSAIAKSSGYTVVAADSGATINATASLTLSLTAAATLGANFTFDLVNASTGVVTIDPNSSETINGTAALKIFPGERATIVCDGSGWQAFGLAPLVLLSSQTVSVVSSVSFLSLFDTSFSSFEVRANGLLTSSGQTDVRARVSTNAGSTWFSGATDYKLNYVLFDQGGTLGGSSIDDTNISTCQINNGSMSSFEMELFDLNSTTNYKTTQQRQAGSQLGGLRFMLSSARLIGVGSSVVNGLQFSPNSGAMTGTFKLYGRR